MRKILFVAFSALLFSISMVSAAVLPAPPIATKELINFFSNLLVGPAAGVDLVGRLLLFLLLTIVLYRASEKVIGEGKTGLTFTVSALVSLIALRFMTNNMIKGMFLPYTTLGIVLSIFFPLILFGFFVETSNLGKGMRRIGWVLMIAIFLSLWWTRYTEIGDMAWIYAVAAVVSLTIMLLDGTIRKFAVEAKIAKSRSTILNIQIDAIQQKIDGYYEQLKSAVSAEARNALVRKIADLEKDLKELTKKLSNQ